MRIFLARHGETDANREGIVQGDAIDAPLNDAGRTQARALGKHLVEHVRVHYDAIYASSLTRARETAEIVADALGRRVTSVLPSMREVSWGEWMGRRVDAGLRGEIERVLRAWRDGDARVRAPGGESASDVWLRAREAFDRFVLEHRHDTILVVGHERVNRIALSELLHGDLHHMEDFPQSNGGYTIVDREAPTRGSRASWFAPVRNMTQHLRDFVIWVVC